MMTNLISVLFGSSKKNVSKSSKNGKQNRRHHSRRSLRLESLESRQMLAGGGLLVYGPPAQFTAPVPTPMVQVTNLKVPVLDILPGATGKDVAEMNISVPANRAYARLEEMMFLSPMGGEPLAQNVQNFTLMVFSSTSMGFTEVRMIF